MEIKEVNVREAILQELERQEQEGYRFFPPYTTDNGVAVPARVLIPTNGEERPFWMRGLCEQDLQDPLVPIDSETRKKAQRYLAHATSLLLNGRFKGLDGRISDADEMLCSEKYGFRGRETYWKRNLKSR